MGNSSGIKWNGVSVGTQPTLDVIGANVQLILRDPKTQQEWVTTSQDYAGFLMDNGLISGSKWTETSGNLYPTTIANNVGIGTSSAGSKLTIIGDVYASIGDNSLYHQLEAYDATFTDYSRLSQTFGGFYIDVQDNTNSTNAVLSMSGNGGIYARTNGGSHIAFQDFIGNGNVGIGTVSPGQKLSVNGSYLLHNYDGSNLQTTINGANLGSLNLSAGSVTFNTSSDLLLAVSNFSLQWTDSTNSINPQIQANTDAISMGNSATAPSSNISNVFTILNINNNVGIGTSSPAYKLDLLGDWNFISTDGVNFSHTFNSDVATGIITLENKALTANIENTIELDSSIQLSTSNTSNSDYSSVDIGSSNVLISSTDGILTTEMTTTPTGVGIGTTTPTSLLTVEDGDIEITNKNNGLIVYSQDGTAWRVSVSDLGVVTATAV